MTNHPNAEVQSDQMAGSFSDKRSKPTTKEYLDADLEDVLERLNKNPNGLESEAAFISAVITVRHARVIEKLNKRLVYLTGVAAIATAVLAFVPFVVPSLEAQRLEAKVVSTHAAIKDLKSESRLLKQEIQELRDIVVTLSKKPAGLAPRSANGSLRMGGTHRLSRVVTSVDCVLLGHKIPSNNAMHQSRHLKALCSSAPTAAW